MSNNAFKGLFQFLKQMFYCDIEQKILEKNKMWHMVLLRLLENQQGHQIVGIRRLTKGHHTSVKKKINHG